MAELSAVNRAVGGSSPLLPANYKEVTMKINRIDIRIPNNQLNKHNQYLYNDVTDFVKKVKVGGLFENSGITLNQVPEPALKLLEDAKIFFERIIPKKK